MEEFQQNFLKVTDQFQQFALWFVCLNLVLGSIALLVYRSYVRPLHELAATFLTLPQHLLPNLPEGTDSVTDVVRHAKAIKHQLVQHHLNRSESQESLTHLKSAIAQIHSLHDEQIEFLRTLSAEMESTFSAISRYAGFVEGGLQEDYFHTDDVFLENLKDSAQNLKFLSNAFYLMCLHKSGNYVPVTEKVELHALLLQVISLFQTSADFREMHLAVDTTGPCVLEADSAVMRHLFWGTMYLLAHFADDGAKLTFTLTPTDEGMTVTARASQCLPGLVNDTDPDLAAFFPDSLSKTGQLHAGIRSHVDFRVIDYLAQHFCQDSGVQIKTSSSENSSLSFELVLTLRSAAAAAPSRAA